MNNVDEYKVEITTGQYVTAPLEQQLVIRHLLGENVECHFEIYFHWYNMIHELGHAIFEFNCPNRPHPADEEQLVNQFAIAYWRHYGEIEKLESLCSIVHDSLRKFVVPTDNAKDHLAMQKNTGALKNYTTLITMGGFSLVVSNILSLNTYH